MNNVFKQVKRSFAVLSALFITVVTSKIRSHHNYCGPERLAECSKPLSVLTDSGLTFASSKPDLDRMCPDLRDSVRCIHGYTRHCMSMEERAHFRILFNGTEFMVRDLCENETYQEEYLKYAPCMKKVEKENEVCFKRYERAMLDIERRKEEQESTPEPDLITYQKRKREAADEGIKSVCCSFQEYVQCSTHTMRRACGEDAAQFSKDFLDKMSSSLIRLHCREYGPRECGLMSAGYPLKSSLILTFLSVLVYYAR